MMSKYKKILGEGKMKERSYLGVSWKNLKGFWLKLGIIGGILFMISIIFNILSLIIYA